jgi:uncharacterized protein YndB with AHSA1/START domain
MRTVLAALLSIALASAASASEPTSCARTEANWVRTLCHEIVVAAPRAEVWKLWSTTAGLSTWVAPLAAIDLRVGGLWESSYAADARAGDAGNIHNRVLSYLPERMLSIQVERAPPGFPHADLVTRLWTVIELEPADAAHTRVRVTMTGFGAGVGFDALHAQFDRGNATTLRMLDARIANGPVDWRRLAAPTTAPGEIKEGEKRP